MTRMQRIIVADAVLERGKYSWVWVVPVCPYCGKPHAHYGGSHDTDPSRYLGQMTTSRCDKTDRRRISPGAPATKLEYILQADTLRSLAPDRTQDTVNKRPQARVERLEEQA